MRVESRWPTATSLDTPKIRSADGLNLDDDAEVVDRDQGVERCFEDASEPGLTGQKPLLRLLPRKHFGPKLDLRHGAAAQFLDQLKILVRPVSGTSVDHAEGADHLSIGHCERNSEISDHIEFPDCFVLTEIRVLSCVLNNQRFSFGDDMLAERMRERCLSPL